MKKKELIDYYKESSFPLGVLLRMIPADKINFKPTDKSWTLGQLAKHCTETPGAVIMAVDNSWPSQEEMQKGMGNSLEAASMNGEEAAKEYEKNVKTVLDRLEKISDKDLDDKQISLPWGMGGSMGKVIHIMIDHQNTHKTELFMYLKYIGLPVNTMTLYMGKAS